MASNTSINLRNATIYQIFTRQFSKTHDFNGITEKLDIIKKQNIDIIYLLPIHPIGKLRRKGSLGSPYSIKNYYEINPDLGTIEDFKRLIDEAHRRELKVMLDIVFNHTAHDADYTSTNPEFYYRQADGTFGGRVGDWWDIIDFDFNNNPALESELINVLKYWVNFGIDGLRCDVAPLLPLAFWQKARFELDKINPELIYLAESVHLSFIKQLRDRGYDVCSDGEMYQVFDICYDYDIFDEFHDYLNKKKPLSVWVRSLMKQEAIYPKNYIKLRFLENHDQNRIGKFIQNPCRLRNYSVLLYMLKGTTMIYNGQECAAVKTPDLFGLDEIDWRNYNKIGLADIFRKMSRLKKEAAYQNGIMTIDIIADHALRFTYKTPDLMVCGIVNLGECPVYVNIASSGYDWLSGQPINAGIRIITEPLVLIAD